MVVPSFPTVFGTLELRRFLGEKEFFGDFVPFAEFVFTTVDKNDTGRLA